MNKAEHAAFRTYIFGRCPLAPLASTNRTRVAKGTLYCYGSTGDKFPVYRATCKYFGCSHHSDVECDGIEDHKDEAIAKEELLDRGWSQSVFDHNWMCPKHGDRP